MLRAPDASFNGEQWCVTLPAKRLFPNDLSRCYFPIHQLSAMGFRVRSVMGGPSLILPAVLPDRINLEDKRRLALPPAIADGENTLSRACAGLSVWPGRNTPERLSTREHVINPTPATDNGTRVAGQLNFSRRGCCNAEHGRRVRGAAVAQLSGDNVTRQKVAGSIPAVSMIRWPAEFTLSAWRNVKTKGRPSLARKWRLETDAKQSCGNVVSHAGSNPVALNTCAHGRTRSLIKERAQPRLVRDCDKAFRPSAGNLSRAGWPPSDQCGSRRPAVWTNDPK